MIKCVESCVFVTLCVVFVCCVWCCGVFVWGGGSVGAVWLTDAVPNGGGS
jgi:hypothetical protein